MHAITLPGFSTASSVQVGSAIHRRELDRTYVQIAVDYGNRVTEAFFHTCIQVNQSISNGCILFAWLIARLLLLCSQ